MGGIPALIHLSLKSQVVAEHMLHIGYDGVVVDVQHGEVGVEGACEMLRGLPRGLEYAWTRIPSIDSGVIGRLLDAGARGVIAPAVETLEQARALVLACKYPPLGGRSLGPSRPDLYSGEDYTAAGNRAVKVVAQFETAAGVEAADEIMALPGIDAAYIGPADLAVSYGLGARLDWETGPVFDAIARLSGQAREHGLAFGVFCASPEYAAFLAERGLADYAAIGTDISLLSKQATTIISTLRGTR